MKETAYATLSHRWLPSGELTFQDTSAIASVIGGFHNLISNRKEAQGDFEEENFLTISSSISRELRRWEGETHGCCCFHRDEGVI